MSNQTEIQAKIKKVCECGSKIIVCVLCGDICECDYGNNPYPLSDTGRCCNNCNKSVIQARVVYTHMKDKTVDYIYESIYPFAKKHGLNTVGHQHFEDNVSHKKDNASHKKIIKLIISSAEEGRQVIMRKMHKYMCSGKNLNWTYGVLEDDYKEGINQTTLLYEVELNDYFAKYKVYADKCDAKKIKEAEKIKNEVEVKVVKKDTKKEQTRNANKAQSDKKAEKAAYEKQCIAAAIIKAAQEQKKKAKKQARK